MNLKKNKRGDFTGILYLIVMITAFAFFLLIAGYIGDKINTAVKDQINSNDTNVNQALNASINISNHTLSAVWYIVFAGLLIGLIITSWYMPTQPIFVPVFIILLIIAIIVGIAMSNAYEEFYAVDDFEDISATQTSINFIMSNLPYTALIIGIISLIVTFAKPKEEAVPMM